MVFNVNHFKAEVILSDLVLWDLNNVRWTILSLKKSQSFSRVFGILFVIIVWPQEPQVSYFLLIKSLHNLFAPKFCFFPTPPHTRQAIADFHILEKLKQKAYVSGVDFVGVEVAQSGGRSSGHITNKQNLTNWMKKILWLKCPLARLPLGCPCGVPGFRFPTCSLLPSASFSAFCSLASLPVRMSTDQICSCWEQSLLVCPVFIHSHFQASLFLPKQYTKVFPKHNHLLFSEKLNVLQVRELFKILSLVAPRVSSLHDSWLKT